MKIKFFIGGHRSHTEHFHSVLIENSDRLKAENITYSTASRRTYKRLLESINLINSGSDLAEIQSNFLEAITRGKEPETLLIVDPKLIGAKNRQFPKAFNNRSLGKFFADLKLLFQGYDLRLYCETRSPETLIKAAYSEAILSGNFQDFETFLSDIELNEFRWSTFIHSIQGKDSRLPTSAWRFEDYAYIWRDIIGAFTGVSHPQDLLGKTGLESTGLGFTGARFFNKYSKEYPDHEPANLAKVRDIFLKKFPDTSDESAGGFWKPEDSEALAYGYDDDWYYIDRMQNVEIIRPRSF